MSGSLISLFRVAGAAFVLAACLSGCATKPFSPQRTEMETSQLREQLLRLSPSVDHAEAAQLAAVAVEESLALAREYRAVRPAWIQNLLVNSGHRPRGLCYQWANDLYPRLHKVQAHSLVLHLGVARMDTGREHNCIIVTAQGQPFNQGVVLDPWRNSGRLWYGLASKDKYPWKPLPPDRTPEELQRLVSK